LHRPTVVAGQLQEVLLQVRTRCIVYDFINNILCIVSIFMMFNALIGAYYDYWNDAFEFDDIYYDFYEIIY